MIEPEAVDWAGLLAESQQTLREIALRFSLGFTHGEIAAALGIKPSMVSERAEPQARDHRPE